MLSVSVVPSVSVESAMESSDVLNDVFLRCVFQRYDDCVPLEETAFGGHASLQHADPSIADFLEHLTAACLCFVMHAGRKCPQFCANVVAIFLAPKPRVAMRSMAKRSSADRTML